jgi:hypothetical protein
MHTILENAVQSLQIGVEDYQSADQRRALSTVCNITVRVLLKVYRRLAFETGAKINWMLLPTELQKHGYHQHGITWLAIDVHEAEARMRESFGDRNKSRERRANQACVY